MRWGSDKLVVQSCVAQVLQLCAFACTADLCCELNSSLPFTNSLEGCSTKGQQGNRIQHAQGPHADVRTFGVQLALPCRHYIMGAVIDCCWHCALVGSIPIEVDLYL